MKYWVRYLTTRQKTIFRNIFLVIRQSRNRRMLLWVILTQRIRWTHHPCSHRTCPVSTNHHKRCQLRHFFTGYKIWLRWMGFTGPLKRSRKLRTEQFSSKKRTNNFSLNLIQYKNNNSFPNPIKMTIFPQNILIKVTKSSKNHNPKAYHKSSALNNKL